MTLLFVLGILFVAAAATLVLRLLVASRLRTAAQLREIEVYGFAPSTEAAAGSPGTAAFGGRLDDLASGIGRIAAGRSKELPVDKSQLHAAGLFRITPEAFHGYRVLATLLIPGFILALTLAGSFGLLQVLLLVVSAAVCWLGPEWIVRSRAQRRLQQIDRALPELVDVLTATIEAGLGFAGSLQLVANRFTGPLGEELQLTLQEQSMGLSSERALQNLLDRANTPSVRAFVRAVQQGDSLGVSIASTLRKLASETRKRRRQTARAEIQRAPVKMLFPLIFLIFPSLLIVLLYPAMATLLEQLSGP